ncbi:aminopeptidase [Gemmatimonas sp.]|uniref:aminopeptidase n=1 Tax=Gemmatimonas sp. TaxID=1962908 RepID=UPI00286C6D90|nr:aminopeptidase [Gemmatimonas sp.]
MPHGRISWRSLRRISGATAVLLAVVLGITPTGCYISRAAYEEARILSRRQPIARLVADSATDPVLRAKLSLVQEARRFAIDSLDLKARKSFTAFSRLDRDTLVLVVSAAYRDRLERKTWWFPVVGRFPYKGFFDFPGALRTAESLRDQGFDVSVGPSAAFSTLGWFNDPLVSTTVKADSVTLVNTIIHELLHNTFFAKGQVSFNESFATFVGGRGVEHFFRARGDSASLRRAEDEWHDDLLLGAFWERTSNEIEQIFAALPDSASTARITARDRVYARARIRLVDSIGPLLRTYPDGWSQKVKLNNAVLLSRRVYAERLDRFDSVYVAEGRDLKRAIQRIIATHKDSVSRKDH